MKPPSRISQTLFAEAVAFMRQGEFAAAETCFRKLLRYEPRNADVCHLAGLTIARLERPLEAVTLLRRAVSINGNSADIHFDLAITLKELGRDEEALASLDRSLALAPDLAEAHYHRGAILLKLKAPESAAMAFRQAILLQPDFALAHNDLGYSLSQLEKHQDALISYQKAVSLEPDSGNFLLNTGNALCANQRHAEALVIVDRVLHLKPDDPVARNLNARALLGLGRMEEALAILEALLAENPTDTAALGSQATALLTLGRYEQALAIAEAARAAMPDQAATHYTCGYVLAHSNRLEEALASYGQAVRLDPDHTYGAWAYALTLLTLGRFDEGWSAYEARNRRPEIFTKRQFPQPLWLGQETIKGKRLFVYWEQGFGDTIHFSRYVLLAASAGASIAFAVQNPLLRLIRSCFEGVTVIAQNEIPTDFDLHCPLLSMPLGFGTRLETIPSMPGGYLKARDEDIAFWQHKLVPARRRIGLVWSGSTGHLNDMNRSLPLALLQGLVQPDSMWVSLQKEVRNTDRPALEAMGLMDPSAQLQDFADTAALISALDLVITVDTAVAHLAGALGKACWLMLPFAPDFRWLMDREDTPWYPGMRLFRQQKPRDWHDVIARMRAELQQ